MTVGSLPAIGGIVVGMLAHRTSRRLRDPRFLYYNDRSSMHHYIHEVLSMATRLSNRRLSKTSLRKAIDTHLVSLGFTKNCNGYFVDGELTKQRIRDLHSKQRRDKLAQHRAFNLGLFSEASGP